jgi:rubrerythrin
LLFGGNLSTNDNLKTAFAGEAKAFMKYLAFAGAAERDGFKQVARLFRALAEAEKIHAQNHLLVMGEIVDTESNMMSSIDGETYEFTQMYPHFITQAEKEGDHRAEISFRAAMAAEKVHGNLLKRFLEKLGKDKDLDLYVCSVCGNVSIGETPDKCPGCGASADKIRLVE